jgi:hypothetical protein
MAVCEVNPYCECDPCSCERPCTCGLTQVAIDTDESWNPEAEELTYTVTRRYRRQLPTQTPTGNSDPEAPGTSVNAE